MWLGEGGGDMGSLDGLREGFEQDPILLLAWVHYLSFDLFVGMWITRDRARLGLSPWPVAPCLLLTLMLGPVGLALYLGLRWATRRTLRFEVDAPQDAAPQDDDVAEPVSLASARPRPPRRGRLLGGDPLGPGVEGLELGLLLGLRTCTAHTLYSAVPVTLSPAALVSRLARAARRSAGASTRSRASHPG